MVAVVSSFPPPNQVPLAASPTPPKRGFRRWPLWAKIATPIGGLLIVGGVGNALSTNDESSSVRPLAAVETTVIETAESVPPSTAEQTTTSSTIAVTTVEATSTLPATTPPTPAPSSVATTTPDTSPPPPPPPTTTAATDPRFDTCKEAKAHGYGPYQRGLDPEYEWYRDVDNDGVVCE